ncbi:MAG: pantoate--beta-alanine ligase [Candidatus Eisenbacteria bacterium]
MKRIRTASALTRAVRAFREDGESIGFVPTMGFLHEGHLSLVRRARRENDRVVASIFVNPLQFAPTEDLDAYPRDMKRDRKLLSAEGVDLVYEPEAAALYPDGYRTHVEVSGLDGVLCGVSRPGHFRGVTTVVTKLLHAADPDRLYLGQKDHQQAVILARMVRDLDFAVKVIVCPTVREKDGLAMSSRNAYLTPEERAWAPNLQRALLEVKRGIEAGRIKRPDAATREVSTLLASGPGALDYAEVLSRDELVPVDPLRGKLVLAAAYKLGRARLIDNVWPEAGKRRNS